jgi:hypothetical protein
MQVTESATRRRRAHANATVRLCSAREELWRLESRHVGAAGSPAESLMLRRVAEASAKLAAREEWLHWIEHGTTVRPEADGEWGFRPGSDDAPSEPSADRPLRPGPTPRRR